MTLSRSTGIGLVVAGVAVGAMAVDHLIGTESEPGEDDSFPVDPLAFVVGSAVSLVLTALLFGVLVRRAERAEPDRAAPKAIALAVLAVLTIPLLFLGVPFPLAGAAIALGLVARVGAGRRIATAAVVLGAAVMVAGAGAYLAALVV